jgi:hypothetical protein
VEERGDQRRGVQVELREYVRDRKGMLDEVLTRDALLAGVRGLRDGRGALDQLQVGLGVVALDGSQEQLEGLALAGLAGAQACQETSPALGPDLLATLQVETSFPPSLTAVRKVPRSAPCAPGQ